MNVRKIKQVISIAASVGVITTFVAEQIKETRAYRNRLKKIQFDKEQDLLAVGRASGRVEERLDNGKYRTITDAMNDFDNEIEFQKIMRRF